MMCFASFPVRKLIINWNRKFSAFLKESNNIPITNIYIIDTFNVNFSLFIYKEHLNNYLA